MLYAAINKEAANQPAPAHYETYAMALKSLVNKVCQMGLRYDRVSILLNTNFRVMAQL